MRFLNVTQLNVRALQQKLFKCVQNKHKRVEHLSGSDYCKCPPLPPAPRQKWNPQFALSLFDGGRRASLPISQIKHFEINQQDLLVGPSLRDFLWSPGTHLSLSGAPKAWATV